MRQLLSFILLSTFTCYICAQRDFREKQRVSNSVLFTIETHDGKRYLTSDALFHSSEITYMGWLKVEEKYKRMGVKTMILFKLPADVKAMAWKDFIRRKGITIHKNDTVYYQSLPIGTLYEPLLSPDYITGIKRNGHRVDIVYKQKMNRKPSWATEKARDSVYKARAQRQRATGITDKKARRAAR